MVGSESFKTVLGGSLKQMQMRQSNSDHICLGEDVTLNINRAMLLLRNVWQNPVDLKGNATQMTGRCTEVFPTQAGLCCSRGGRRNMGTPPEQDRYVRCVHTLHRRNCTAEKPRPKQKERKRQRAQHTRRAPKYYDSHHSSEAHTLIKSGKWRSRSHNG